MKISPRKRYSTFQLIALGFIPVILIGTLLLMLPFSVKGDGGASFLDALFTSTSAVCVTGLVTHDTATFWTPFGKIVIMTLIQIGGMGVVTLSVFFAMISGRKIGLMQRSAVQEAIAAHHVGGIVRLTSFIIKTTLSVELVGSVLLAPVFFGEFGVLKGVCYSLFHSISAFCNAGFDLMGVYSPYSSLTSYSAKPLINIVIMLLIIIGGIGFLTWEDIKTNKLNVKRYRMQTKVILSFTLFLIVAPAVYFFFGEFSAYPLKERLLLSFFASVSPRTAGFNTADLTLMSDCGKAVTIVLMLIGGSPGSTAGGIKTTTAAVLFASALSVFARRESPQLFKRRIGDDIVKNAAAILIMYLVLFLAGGLVISKAEGLPLGVCLFETASAIGTVGLTLGITPTLSVLSKIILIFLMFFGRVGGLTVVFATVAGSRKTAGKYPKEKITVG